MLALAGKTIEKKLIPVYCREAENGFIGVKSGIMDQFIIAFGKENNALFLNCNNLEHRLIPLVMQTVLRSLSGTQKLSVNLQNQLTISALKSVQKGSEF